VAPEVVPQCRRDIKIASQKIFRLCVFSACLSMEIIVKSPPVFCVSLTPTCELEALSDFHTLHILTFLRLWLNMWHIGSPATCLFFLFFSQEHPSIRNGFHLFHAVCSFSHNTNEISLLVWSPSSKKGTGELGKVKQSIARVILVMMVSKGGKVFA